MSFASFSLRKRICSYIAFRIDEALRLEQRGAHFNYFLGGTAPWWFINAHSEVHGRMIRFGNFELIVNARMSAKGAHA